VDQTTGYRENCKVIESRRPDFIVLAGDLVESGGEQRDWDEFWRHNAGEYSQLAGSIPIFAALGNHENYAGPGGGYSAAGANFATGKFLTYFDVPTNDATDEKHRGRYYRVDYGPITLITLDSSDGLPHQTVSDTNHLLQESNAPDFNPGSEQYKWFETQLADAQRISSFTFVQFHHTMFGSGPHSIPFGKPNFSGQSGIAMRVLQPLLFRYGVDAVFSGHDELMERSLVTGTETLADGSEYQHSIHFYDVGIGGDGLRGPSTGFDNPYRKFLAHEDAPEVWQGNQLVSGGKHYGHLEVNVARNADQQWEAELIPVHVFPLQDSDGKVIGWERRTYNDRIKLKAASDRQKGTGSD
jgi:3',5'-cyclic AMP phosphodiesterase CpdA